MKIINGQTLGQEKWDGFVSEQSADGGLLQSWGWGELQISQGKQIFRLAVEDNNEIKAVAQVIKQPLPLKFNYFYLPRGPIVKDLKDKETLDFLFVEIKKIAEKEKAIFLRFDPAWPIENLEELKSRKLISVGQVQPKKTLILDLNLSEEDLLKQMKAKTRYNIKVAQKHGLKLAEGEEYFEDFWRLMEQTSDRDEFSAHSKKYYEKLVKVLGKFGLVDLLVVKDGDKVAAAMIASFFGHWAVYLHGASDYNLRDKMAPYLLQWQGILLAKKLGCISYDFWGVDEKKWPGVTRFKVGFAPEKNLTEYVGAWDESYRNFWYNIYRRIK